MTGQARRELNCKSKWFVSDITVTYNADQDKMHYKRIATVQETFASTTQVNITIVTL